MKEKLIIIGAGGHSKSVVNSVDTDVYQIVGFLDDNKVGSHIGYAFMVLFHYFVCEKQYINSFSISKCCC